MPAPTTPLGRSSLALLLLGLLGVGLLVAIQPLDRAEYVARRVDSICGLSDVRLLSNPAVVDHPRLMAATPEVQRIVAEGIDPASALGQILFSEGRRRVTSACTKAMQRLGHCSVWSAIRRRDGVPIVDRTVEVLAQLPEERALSAQSAARTQ